MSCNDPSHNHSHDLEEQGQEFSLFQHIAIDKVSCLNEKVSNSVRSVFKPWEQRLDTSKYLESNSDEELILHVPFTGAAKIKSIVVIGGDNGQHPSRMKLYINREDIDFSNVNDMTITQEFELHEDHRDEVEYKTRVAKFSGVHHLTIYFPSNFGAETTTVFYIGLKGEFTPVCVIPSRRSHICSSYKCAKQNIQAECVENAKRKCYRHMARYATRSEATELIVGKISTALVMIIWENSRNPSYQIWQHLILDILDEETSSNNGV